MMKITVLHDSGQNEIEVHPSDSVSDLKMIVSSVTSIEPDFLYITRQCELIQDSDYQLVNILLNGDFISVKALPMPLSEFLKMHPQGSPEDIDKIFEEKIPVAVSPYKFSDGSSMIVKNILKDNCCLFSAIHYAETQNSNSSHYLREHVSRYILKNQAKYTKDTLGHTPSDYANWILDPFNWGGEIELIILSEFIQKQIDVICINPFSVQRFGNYSDYRKKIYLLFTGAHYNLIVRNFPDAGEEMDVTIFRNICAENDQAAYEAAEEYRLQHQENEEFQYMCLDCGLEIKGKSNCMAHGQETGHNLVGMGQKDY